MLTRFACSLALLAAMAWGKDDEEKQGNSVKLTLWNLMRAESTCFERGSKAPEPGDPSRRFEHRRGEPVDWDRFVPE